jgi:serine/threonine-protein kinase
VGNYYYVVMDYSSDRVLEQARTIVPDAHVHTFPNGTKVQMGAFLRESEAKTLVEQLQQQGVSASIYRLK